MSSHRPPAPPARRVFFHIDFGVPTTIGAAGDLVYDVRNYCSYGSIRPMYGRLPNRRIRSSP